jgi:hypothetical protein
MRCVHIFFSCVLLLSAASCSDEPEIATLPDPTRIVLNGRKLDTAYLFTTYRDPGASYFEDRDGTKNCNDYGIVTNVTGQVNTNVPGTYYLTYNAQDSTGTPMPAVTRTVIVMEGATHFLNGLYTVACTCTATAPGSKPVVTSQNYTAVVNPGVEKNQFEIITLDIGGEKIIPRSTLEGEHIYVGYFTANFDWTCSSGSGTLSPSKNSFTIETTAQRFTPAIKYICTNVYTKLVTIKQSL